MGEQIQNVFVVGCKGIPGAYGGYETFVDKLTEYHENVKKIKYHVACKNKGETEFEYHNARCFNVNVPNIGSAQAIYYDLLALKKCFDYIREHHIQNFIIYILACRIGPFAPYIQKKVHSLGGELYVNPDGHEWMRAKWSKMVRMYWKFSERIMTKHADLLVCDSVNIEKYIKKTYEKYNPKTVFIAYGAETKKIKLYDKNEKFNSWLRKNGLQIKDYYLVVGRFVPENNFETMISEFISANTNKKLAIITTTNDTFLEKLEKKLHFNSDSRIKFVGTVYDQNLLREIRENAYGYFHGHEVGGTNPSLLEALNSTSLNLLLDVSFNREVAQNAALYWTKEKGTLAELIEKADKMSCGEIEALGEKAKKRICQVYSWEIIAEKYEDLFLG